MPGPLDFHMPLMHYGTNMKGLFRVPGLFLQKGIEWSRSYQWYQSRTSEETLVISLLSGGTQNQDARAANGPRWVALSKPSNYSWHASKHRNSRESCYMCFEVPDLDS